MKDRVISFDRNNNPELVVDKDGELAKKLHKIYNDITLNLGFCYEQLVKGKLSEGMKESHLYLAEHYMIDFLKEVDYDSILARENDKRHVQIKSLNEENRELREQLGEKVSNEDARERMKNISESFKRWWNIDGFGHTSDLHFTSQGAVEAKLSGRITDGYYADPREKRKDKTARLKEYGFNMISDDDEKEILVSDSNSELLIKLLKNRFNSAEIIEFNTAFWGGKNRYRDIKVLIRDLSDFDEPLENNK